MKVTLRILVVKLAALGDVIMASTLVCGIRAEYPDAELTWVVGAGAAPIVRLMRGVDRVIEVAEGALLGGRRLHAGVAMLKAWHAIGRGYDLALVAHTDARYELLVKASGAKTVRRFANATGPRPGKWHGAEYLRLVREDFAIDTFARFPALKHELVPRAPIAESAEPFVIVAPGGGRNLMRDDALRRWPLASWAAVVQTLTAQGLRVVCVGGADDAEEGAACAAMGATDLTGRTSLVELFALMQSASTVVTHDAGPLHIALLAQRPVVALFGPTRGDERIPVWANAVVLSSAWGLPCAPCYDGHDYAACALNLCLTRVRPSNVVAAIEGQLGSTLHAPAMRDSRMP